MADQSGDAAKAVYPPSSAIQNAAHVKSMKQYREMHKQSIDDPATFWGKIIEEFGFHFETPPSPDKCCFVESNFDVREGRIDIKWMQGAKTNVCYNVLDRNVKNGLGNNIAFYW